MGCGTGMSTSLLAAIWQDAEIVGADMSEEMLQNARETVPTVTFIQRDCSKSLSDMEKFHLIFSNAFLQWIPNQEEFMARSFDLLYKGGVFAAQVPLFGEMPANQCILEADKYVLHSASQYYDMLLNSTHNITMWVTEYCHEMENHNKVLGFLKGAALRPHIDRLDQKEQTIFMDKC